MNTTTIKSKPLLAEGYYLTDGGLETTLIFHEGIELNHFAAFELLTRAEGRKILTNYYKKYLDIAQKHGWNFILEASTWRANSDWGFKLGYTQRELNEINREAIEFLCSIQAIRANASTKFHAELDEAEELDRGNLQLLANGFDQLQRLLSTVS